MARPDVVDARFVPPLDARRAADEKDERVVIKHSLQGKPLHFKVVDSAQDLKPQDWCASLPLLPVPLTCGRRRDRVVAVFSNGQPWQFRGWKWAEPADLFANVVGLYAHWDDEKLPDSIRSWNVRRLPVSRHKRHLDAKVALDVWASIEAFMLKRKREYLA
jgi:parafibromin